jgi:protein tyrosine/serine phosphatase
MIWIINIIALKRTFVVFLCYLLISGCNNFHEVSKGKLFRSGQLTKNEFDKYIHKYNIKTVINLRGTSPQDKWYKEELTVAKENGICHLDFNLTATKYVHPQYIDSMLLLASSTAIPILVHCKAGADRTGLFCAAWLYTIDHQQTNIASKQLSILFGHIPFFIWSRTDAMDNSFRDYINKKK